MCRTGQQSDPHDADDEKTSDAAFAALLEDSAEELYECAPCGYLSTLMDGTIAKINTTLLDWLGLNREAVVGRMRFTDLLTVGGRLYHETHFAPLLRMQGEIGGVALEIRKADGVRMPVLASSVVKHGATGEPLLIRTTLFDARDRRAYEEELLRARRAAEEAQRQAEADRARLQDALAALQSSLLPDTLPPIPGMESAAHYRTASPDRLGGDFYDVFRLDAARFVFFLGDVCGKGPQAAAVTSLTRYTLRAAALHDPDPASALTTLNRVLHERYSSGDPRYCTAIFGTLEPDPVTGQVTVHLASGGHPPALVLRADGTADFLPTPGGLLVGILPTARFTPATITLGPGDTLLLYTDGLTEARTGESRTDLYGDEALRAFATDQAGRYPQAVMKALTGLLDSFGDGLDDDTALLALGVPASGSREPA
ncbi:MULTISPECIES: PP2C family protein-serine/threonine phosphatase [Streptomyces]|uniref:PP2C family protein-serine/threonine phosphatase n=1 Tax=Streptomyces TaxID=1883 RepID=UPI0004C5DBAF|nr:MULTISPECIES: SpoIIE family protein phosphatase [Streptomyces]KOU96914.1 histidine kinase [Streptomyces sp. XY58]KOU99637.1 histidine kinase [Streptomyces sp. XY37]KOV39453.1 histidine kinase [Streptomyces sp. MMG1064]